MAVSEMDKVTQQKAANAEESASAAEELSSQAQELNAIVGGSHGQGAEVKSQRSDVRTLAAQAPVKVAQKAPMSRAVLLEHRMAPVTARKHVSADGQTRETGRSDSAG